MMSGDDDRLTNQDKTSQPEAQSDSDKQKAAIYNHPLLKLMVLLFEKCECATLTAECPKEFDRVINEFIKTQEIFLSNDIELDTLVVKAIQVLRIHLLELAKVGELCNDFCTRYVSCLKAKLQSENLLRVEGCDLDFDGDFSPSEGSPPMRVTTAASGSSSQTSAIVQQPSQPPSQVVPSSQMLSCSTMYQMVQTPQGLVAHPIQIQTTPVAGATSGYVGSSIDLINNSSPSDRDGGHKMSKRGILPKSATHIMKTWLFQNVVHPYPTEDQKRQLALQTNLSLLQVNNWFINARRRILQPMLDAGSSDKPKKARPQPKQNNRHWPHDVQSLPMNQVNVECVEEGPLEMIISCKNEMDHSDDDAGSDHDEDSGESDALLKLASDSTFPPPLIATSTSDRPGSDMSTALLTSLAPVPPTLVVPTPPKSYSSASLST